MLVTPDHEQGEYPIVSTGGEETDSTPHPEAQQVLEVLATATLVPPSGVGEPGLLPKKVCTKGCLPPSSQ
jgi:hypothetical protein